MNLKLIIETVCFLNVILCTIDGVWSVITTRAWYETDYKCNDGNSYIVLKERSLTLKCEYGLQKDQLDALEWYKTYQAVQDNVFDFQGDEAYIKNSLRNRANYTFRDTGLDLMIDLMKADDKGIYKCKVETVHDVGEASVNLTDIIKDLPTKEQLNDQFDVKVTKTLSVKKGFGSRYIEATVKPDPKFDCTYPKVVWELKESDGSQKHSETCEVNKDPTVCIYEVKEQDLSAGDSYDVTVHLEHYGVQSDKEEFIVKYDTPNNLLWLLLLLFIPAIIVGILLFLWFKKRRQRGL